MPDLAGTNAVVFYTEVTSEQMTRRNFLLQLAGEMQIAVKKSTASNGNSDVGFEVLAIN